MNDCVIGHTSGYQSLHVTVRFLHQNLLHRMDISSTDLCGNRLYLCEQTVETFFDNFFWNLIFHRCRRSSGALRINKGKCTVVADFPHNLQCLLEIFLRLSRKSNDDIRRQGNIRYRLADALCQFQILLLRVMAVHLL